MPLRRRLAIACASAVALAILLASIVVYVVVRQQLLGQVDSELRAQAGLVNQLRCSNIPTPPPSAGGGAPIWQVSTSTGQVLCSDGNVPLPVDNRVQQIAGGNAGAYFEDVKVNGTVLRELTVPVQIGSFGGPARPGGLPARAAPRRSPQCPL